ncbi:TetR/AcrR family transcriptional regulator [Lentzea pudingi]|uniref:TetR/AcrR family transcriptional regulator n=1 Tax=Lentzea pudingi TaxID=1789439 RepID=UPI00166DD5C8|nr:TetR/AcrR family transcriptional regulator [Lentzea pudingi]
MPKLSQARQELRRQQILQAAMRCFVRNGMGRTSVADITAESGLSAGSIYTHFASKAEIVQATAQDLLERRLTALAGFVGEARLPSPAQLLRHLADGISRDEARVGLQAWGEATTDPVMCGNVVATTDGMRDAIAAHCEVWLVAVKGHEASVARSRAAGLAAQLMAVYQGLIVRKALFGTTDAADETFIADAADRFA